MNISNHNEKFILEQRKNFLSELQSRIDKDVNSLLDYCLDCDVRRLDDIRISFHSIKGTALILNLEVIAEIAGYYEKYLESLLAEQALIYEDYYNLLNGFSKLRKERNELIMKYDMIHENEIVKTLMEKDIAQDYTTISSEGNILIIDDDPIFLRVINRLLRNEGYHVFISSNQKDMFGILEENSIDLIIQDLIIPGIDGIDLLQQIKVEYTEIPVIILSSKDIVELKVKALKAGANDYLVKSNEIAEILARVETVMNLTRKNKISLNTDILTGAYTKRYSNTIYRDSIMNFRKKNIEFAVAFVIIR